MSQPVSAIKETSSSKNDAILGHIGLNKFSAILLLPHIKTHKTLKLF